MTANGRMPEWVSFICSEIAYGFDDLDDLNRVIPVTALRRAAIPFPAAFLAAKAHQSYRRRGGAKSATLPDFFIGAHALVDRLTIVTRDARRYAQAFPSVRLLSPEGAGPQVGCPEWTLALVPGVIPLSLAKAALALATHIGHVTARRFTHRYDSFRVGRISQGRPRVDTEAFCCEHRVLVGPKKYEVPTVGVRLVRDEFVHGSGVIFTARVFVAIGHDYDLHRSGPGVFRETGESLSERSHRHSNGVVESRAPAGIKGNDDIGCRRHRIHVLDLVIEDHYVDSKQAGLGSLLSDQLLQAADHVISDVRHGSRAVDDEE